MNDPMALTAVSVILAVVCIVLYAGWKRSHPGKFSAGLFRDGIRRWKGDQAALWSGGKPEFPAAKQILSGSMRRPVSEVREMLAAWLLIGTALTVIGLYLNLDIAAGDQPFLAVPILTASLWMLGAAVFPHSRLEHPGVLERSVGWMAYCFGVDLLQVSALIGAAFFLAVSAVSLENFIGATGRWVFGIASAAAAALIVYACRRFFRRSPAAGNAARRDPER